MAVELLTDGQTARHGSFRESPSRAELKRYNRFGYVVQLTSGRFLGRFMPDSRQVPMEVAEYLAGQSESAGALCLRLYGERDGTARAHAGEIQKAEGRRDFAAVREELAAWRTRGRGGRRGGGVAARGSGAAARGELSGPFCGMDVSGVPPRRLAELSRYGMDDKALLLCRHRGFRRLATLLVAAVYLTSRSVDVPLDLLKVLIATKLLATRRTYRA